MSVIDSGISKQFKTMLLCRSQLGSKLAVVFVLLSCNIHPPIQAQTSKQTQDEQLKSQNKPVRELERAVTEAVAKTKYSVVAISRLRKGSAADPSDRDFVPNQLSSGVILDSQGLVLTNYHVLGKIAQNDYYIWAAANPEFKLRVYANAEVLAADPWTDLAVLKIDAENLTPIEFAPANAQKKIGQWVVVIGDPFALVKTGQASSSWGMVSNLQQKLRLSLESLDRQSRAQSWHQYGTLMQFDARLNWESSGGALINLDGQLIGLTTAISTMQTFDRGTGFAIPVDQTFYRVVSELRQGKSPEFGFLGISPRDLSPDLRSTGRFGVQIAEVIPGTPAAKAGLRFGDIVTRIDNKKIENADQLMRILSSHSVDAAIQITVVSGAAGNDAGAARKLNLRLAKRHIATARPVYQSRPLRTWHGLRVDHATAHPDFQSLSQLVDPLGCVAIVDVARDSESWHSGLRPQWFISHVDGRRVTTPNEFFSAAQSASGEVVVRITNDGTGQPRDFSVTPASNNNQSDADDR